MKHTTLAIVATMIVGPAASAAITYVDADGANTLTEAGGISSTDPAVSTMNAASSTDNKWNIRPFGNGLDGIPSGYAPTIYETIGDPNVPLLVTSISGLFPGASYRVFAFFQAGDDTNTSQNWDLLAGLTTGTLVNYRRGDAETSDAVAGDFTTAVQVTDGNRLMVQAPLGTTTADGSGEIKVYIDANGGGSSVRTWYDGVGYEIIPEPGSTTMAGLAAISLILRRRR